MTVTMSVKKVVGDGPEAGWRLAGVLAAIMVGALATYLTGIGQVVTQAEKANMAVVSSDHEKRLQSLERYAEVVRVQLDRNYLQGQTNGEKLEKIYDIIIEGNKP